MSPIIFAECHHVGPDILSWSLFDFSGYWIFGVLSLLVSRIYGWLLLLSYIFFSPFTVSPLLKNAAIISILMTPQTWFSGLNLSSACHHPIAHLPLKSYQLFKISACKCELIHAAGLLECLLSAKCYVVNKMQTSRHLVGEKDVPTSL